MNVTYPSVRQVYVLQISMCPTAQKLARLETKASPRSYGPGTPQKDSSLRGVLLVRSREVDRDAHGCWTGARRTSENAVPAKFAQSRSTGSRRKHAFCKSLREVC